MPGPVPTAVAAARREAVGDALAAVRRLLHSDDQRVVLKAGELILRV